jgi:hypothetical protein
MLVAAEIFDVLPMKIADFLGAAFEGAPKTPAILEYEEAARAAKQIDPVLLSIAKSVFAHLNLHFPESLRAQDKVQEDRGVVIPLAYFEASRNKK